MKDVVLPMFTVYENPKDYPGKVVVRRFDLVAGMAEPRPAPEPLAVVLTIDEARAAIRAVFPHGVRMHRMPGDDPVIVECWL